VGVELRHSPLVHLGGSGCACGAWAAE